MRHAKRLIGLVYFVFFGMLLTLRSASAYIDPATTSYIIQIVAGVFIALGATVAIFWRKISFWFKKKKAMRARKKKEKENN